MKIIVDIKNYTNFKYDEYFDGGTPENNPYVVGQVVAVKRLDRDNNPTKIEDLAVVIGVITPHEVRLDLCGMTAVEHIRPANILDFGRLNVVYPEKLLRDCQGYKISYNWNTYTLTVEEN